ncbi:MAG: molybdopterin-guanine dinucleotide biosynthesis protein B [Chloroflexi bacterium]|nr:molybdopterin-guanine dinucleotide biosynthesis protein B [Chloroflexota bacterium]
MLPIISIVGRSESGKTTLLGKLIPELKRRGLKVAVVKHTGEGFELDKEGKDSWRFAEAGSEVVGVSSAAALAIFRRTDHDLSPQEIARLIKGDYDLLLTEGFKKASTLKIEVHSKEQGNELLSPKEQLLAVVTDSSIGGLPAELPQVAPDEIGEIADLIEKRLQAYQPDEIELYIDGKFVTLKPFVKKWVIDIVLAMVTNLAGVGKAKSVELSIRRRV